MTISHRLSPGRKRRSVIEHFNTQDVSSFLLFHCRGNSAPKLIFISLTDTTSKQFWNPFGWAIACVASVSSRGSSRKLEREQKKKKRNDWGGGGERRNRLPANPTIFSPLPLPLQPFFCFRSNFRAITRLETLATQARWATPILVRRCGPLRSSLHVCWKSAVMAIMPRFLFCLPPISACGNLDTQKILVCHSLKLQAPAVVCVLRYSVLFFLA